MLRLSGEVADGSVLFVSAGLDYIRWASVRIEEGRAREAAPTLIQLPCLPFMR
jgi:hypothetical protein